MYQLVLQNNNGFQWLRAERIYVRGYVIDSLSNNPLGLPELEKLFQKVDSLESFKEALGHITGCFSVILETKNGILACTDNVRSIPLFYVVNDEGIILADTVSYFRHNFGERAFEEEAVNQLRTTGYVLGENTLIHNVKQILAGQIIHFNGRLIKSIYLKPIPSIEIFRSVIYDDVYKLSEKVFGGLAKSIEGKKVLIPLSGGYDSRFIAIMLYKSGIRDCTCYTYGRIENPEVKESRRVAEILGFDWYFIEYKAADWKEIIDNGLLNNYMESAGNYASLPHIQDFLAIHKLINDGKIDKEMVVIPGHSGDMLAGSHIPAELVKRDIQFLRIEEIRYFIKRYHHKYGQCKVGDSWKEHAKNSGLTFSRKSRATKQELISFLDRWNIAERQAKYIANSVRVYEFFSMEWRMPFWHIDFVEFWERVPFELREYRKLYNDFLDERLFPEFELELHKHGSQASDHLSRLPLWADKMIRRIRDIFIDREPEDFLNILAALSSERRMISTIINHYFKIIGVNNRR